MCPASAHAPDRSPVADPAPEIEVTPAMIEAGVNELALCESTDSWWSTAEAVYRAMEAVRRTALEDHSPKSLPPHVHP